jgi:hypothetical protein
MWKIVFVLIQIHVISYLKEEHEINRIISHVNSFRKQTHVNSKYGKDNTEMLINNIIVISRCEELIVSICISMRKRIFL